jgi:hypothetical protein
VKNKKIKIMRYKIYKEMQFKELKIDILFLFTVKNKTHF